MFKKINRNRVLYHLSTFLFIWKISSKPPVKWISSEPCGHRLFIEWNFRQIIGSSQAYQEPPESRIMETSLVALSEMIQIQIHDFNKHNDTSPLLHGHVHQMLDVCLPLDTLWTPYRSSLSLIICSMMVSISMMTKLGMFDLTTLLGQRFPIIYL